MIPTRRPGPAQAPGIGAVLGGAAGLLAGIGALAIPGVGPVMAAGALAAILAGAGVGAAVGGLVGALVEAGIPREHADIYAEAVRRGGTLVTVRIDDAFTGRVSDIFARRSPVDIEGRAESWREAGWRGFDERAEPDTTGGAGELWRDWEVRRDPSDVRRETGRNYVRIYPSVEAPVSDKR